MDHVVFSGVTFIGTWQEGSEIRFTDAEGKSGMFSKIKENREPEFISIEHLGILVNGEVDITSDEVKKWAPAFENYTFTEVDGGTQVDVDMDINQEYKAQFEDMWTKALAKLKEIAEK
jgi:hypothetical protein